ncbi:MAG: sugar ABC transporter permease [Chloroflexota bacterium]
MSRKASLKRYEKYWALAMGLPGMAVLMVFVAVPLILGLGWSFTSKRLISPLATRWVGTANYANLLSLRRITIEPIRDSQGRLLTDENGEPQYPSVRELIKNSDSLKDYREWFRVKGRQGYSVWLAKDPSFMSALVNTIRFVLVIVPCQGGLALLLALLVNRKIKGKNAFRTIFFAPVVTSMAVIAVVWIFLLNPEQGIINHFFYWIFAGSIKPIPWLPDRRYAPIAIYLVSIWQSAGFQMLIFLAGLKSIPEQLYESVYIDGANTWQRFAHITFPMLRNTTIFVVIGTTILAFRVFTQIDIMTKGGPQESTASLIYYVVQQGYREQHIGYASAITVVFFLFVFLVSAVQKVLMKSESEVE